ncbi:MAG: putative DNA-binding domain-containing protein [Candidatus Hydrogenedentes bacterium]|nr:putative DNA-binding domain-containing protein [Candidatus Hydrogenedentota bacterium]
MSLSLQKKDPMDTWPPLSVVQQWFQAVVTHPDGIDSGIESDAACTLMPMTRDELARMVTRSKNLSAEERLSIYANAYYARLLECLGDSFPILKRTVGEEVFNGFAFGYLQRYPSHSYTLVRLGDHFARYLDETRPDREETMAISEKPPVGWPDFLIDVATLEWTIDQVFDGPGIEGKPTLSADDLHGIGTEDWPRVKLQTAPCLRLLKFRFPVNGYYTAVRRLTDASERIPAPAPAESFLAVSRREFIVRRHELSQPQFELLAALQDGETVGESVARAATLCDLDDEPLSRELQLWFRDWTQQQFFEAIRSE